MKKPDGFEEVIKDFEEAGIVSREKTRDGDKFSFTEDGLKATEMRIAMDPDMQLFLFQILWDNIELKEPLPEELVMQFDPEVMTE